MITIHPVPVLKDNYVWVIVNEHKHAAIVVDPGVAEPVQTFLAENKLSLYAIFITHHHWDHTDGLNELKLYSNCNIYGPINDAVSGVTNPVSENDTITIPDIPLTFKIIDIPGHTLGHIAYYAKDMVFCGDTLFSAGCGRLFEGTPGQLYASLQRIAALPKTTKIYCAHEYTLNNLQFAKLVEPNNPAIQKRIKEVEQLRKKNLPSLPSTIAIEKATNPFLRCEDPHVIASVEKHVKEKLNTPLQVFTQLRKWKDRF